MKKNLLKILFVGTLAFFTATSCSSDDSGKENNGDGSATMKFKHKTLIEDATGTWCQYCPRVTYAIEQSKANEANGKDVVAVAVHFGIQQYPDPMQITSAGFLQNVYRQAGLTGYPFGLINRTNKWTSPEPNNIAQIFSPIIKEGSPVGIKIASTLTNEGGTVTASFKFGLNYSDLKYSIFVVENGVVTPQSPQQNSTNYYGGPKADANFVHNDVLRGFAGNIAGNTLGNVTAGQEIVKDKETVSFELFNKDLSKVEVVVFVTDSSGKVLNVQIAHANQTVDYQQL